MPIVGAAREPGVWRPALLAAVAMLVAVVVLALSQGGPAYFIQLGDASRALPFARDVLGRGVPTPPAAGHDGESFWLLSRDPLLREGEPLAARFDRPTYRAQRIGFPLAAAPWQAGGEHALLWGLVLTNVAAIAAGTYATSRLAMGLGL